MYTTDRHSPDKATNSKILPTILACSGVYDANDPDDSAVAGQQHGQQQRP